MSEANVNGTSLFYQANGDGPALMLMHGGLGLDHTYFLPWFNQLADVAQVIYYDHRGHGRSERNYESFEYSHQLLAEDAEALRAHLGHEKMILFGHSYGSFLAQEYAIRYPDRLAGLILANSTPVLDYQPAPSGTDEQLAAFGAAFSGPMESDEAWGKTWSTIVPMYYKEYDAKIGDAIHASTQYAAAGWNAVGGMLGTFNTLEQLPKINVPTLVLTGRHDFITPPGPGAERQHDLLPNSELIIFEDSAHFPFIEEEAAFFEAVRAWLGKL